MQDKHHQPARGGREHQPTALLKEFYMVGVLF
jgi:hypothetical protein